MRKVNDLHTTEITLELARKVGAAAIINRGRDRNRLDLNRVSDVRAQASWLLRLLLEETAAQIARHGQATILFIHGWNAIQPSCDVGIGARLASDSLVPVRHGKPTVATSFLPRLGRFAEDCAAAGVRVTVGDRYPAAGRENMLQIFTARYADDLQPDLRELARLGAAGKISAVQLELAVPLRWPGPLRARVIEALARFAVADAPGSAVDLAALHVPHAPPTPPDEVAVQFHDGGAGIGGFAGIERLSSGRRLARLLLCVGTRRLGLFTGEDAAPGGAALECMDFQWRRGEAGEAGLRYDGPCLTFPRTDPFLDLEAGLADADLSRLNAELRWVPTAPPSGNGEPYAAFGRIEGCVRLDDWSATISSPAALRDGPIADAEPWRERSRLHVPLGEDTVLSISSRLADEERVEGQIARDGRLEPLLSGRVVAHESATGVVPEAWKIEAVSRNATLRVFGHVTHAIPVVRPAADGKILVVFGLARFTAGDRVGYGTFERARRLVQKGTVR